MNKNWHAFCIIMSEKVNVNRFCNMNCKTVDGVLQKRQKTEIRQRSKS